MLVTPDCLSALCPRLVHLLVCSSLTLWVGCDGDASNADDATVADVAVADGAVGSADGMVDATSAPDAELPDAAPPECLAYGRVLVERLATDPLPGLSAIRADVDPNADGQPDLMVTLQTPASTELEFFEGRTMAELGRIGADGRVDLQLMPGLWPLPDLVAPKPVGDAGRVFVLQTPFGPSPAGIRILETPAFESVAETTLPAAVKHIYAMDAPDGWRLLVDLDDGRCGAFELTDDTPPLGDDVFWPHCTVSPAWDVNGDGRVDILRTSTQITHSGLNLHSMILDAVTLEVLMRLPGQGGLLGFIPVSTLPDAPPPGPSDVRDHGQELVSVDLSEGLIVRYHDPENLTVRDESVPLRGLFTRAEFWSTARGIRLLAEEDQRGLRYLRIFDLRGLRARGEVGPAVHLTWAHGDDIDGDGYSEIRVVTGPDDSGRNSEVAFLRASDGVPVLVIEAQRSSRFDPVLLRRSGLNGPAPIDTCPGDEMLVVRSNAPGANGERPSRLRILGMDERWIYEGPDRRGVIHDAVVVDLDGLAPVEVVEIRSDSLTEASVHIYR